MSGLRKANQAKSNTTAGSRVKQESTIVLLRANVLHCWKQWFLKARNERISAMQPDKKAPRLQSGDARRTFKMAFEF
jgi:hypothetical protein